jgi:glycosyltransferase involved in cell wall biosynthesis
MAYGLPCIATATCAIPEIVDDGKTGMLAPPGEVEPLSECLLKLVAAPDLAASMGSAGRRRMAERYTWPAVATKMIDSVRECLAAA